MHRHGLRLKHVIFSSNLLPKAASFTFRLHESEDITFTHGALYVTHDKAVLVIQELHANLSNLATAAGAADDLHNNS